MNVISKEKIKILKKLSKIDYSMKNIEVCIFLGFFVLANHWATSTFSSFGASWGLSGCFYSLGTYLTWLGSFCIDSLGTSLTGTGSTEPRSTS